MFLYFLYLTTEPPNHHQASEPSFFICLHCPAAAAAAAADSHLVFKLAPSGINIAAQSHLQERQLNHDSAAAQVMLMAVTFLTV